VGQKKNMTLALVLDCFSLRASQRRASLSLSLKASRCVSLSLISARPLAVTAYLQTPGGNVCGHTVATPISCTRLDRTNQTSTDKTLSSLFPRVRHLALLEKCWCLFRGKFEKIKAPKAPNTYQNTYLKHKIRHINTYSKHKIRIWLRIWSSR
jgi:hypothetical protein